MKAVINKDLSERVGEEIRSARERAKMTQSELADRVGTYQPSIARLESGRALPNMAFLKRIADSLGATLVVSIGAED